MRISDWSSDVCSSDLILAANAARRMAMAEAPQFNPLYLCSGTGQGKTHLLHAIAQGYAAVHPTANNILMSAEKFMLEFVGALRGGDMMAFKARLRSEEHTSELPSLMRISYAIFCLK